MTEINSFRFTTVESKERAGVRGGSITADGTVLMIVQLYVDIRINFHQRLSYIVRPFMTACLFSCTVF